jgi:hypothetical protein
LDDSRLSVWIISNSGLTVRVKASDNSALGTSTGIDLMAFELVAVAIELVLPN